MKPAPFEYEAPETLDEALARLARDGADAKVLAGGQSLVPLLNLRLTRPARLVDLNRIAALSYVAEASGELRIGAMTRQRAVERSAVARARSPLLVEAIGLIGHAPIRNRGTVGGSLAHADPAAELPAAAAALGATFVIAGPRGRRTVAATEFFHSLFTTAIGSDELLIEVRVPGLPPRTGGAFLEVSRRAGDFALVGAAALVTLDADGRCADAALALAGVGLVPVVADEARAAVLGSRLEAAVLAEAGARVEAAVDPAGDIHASAAYRRRVSAVLARRALVRARERALGALA